jgi:hypothetical protein
MVRWKQKSNPGAPSAHVRLHTLHSQSLQLGDALFTSVLQLSQAELTQDRFLEGSTRITKPGLLKPRILQGKGGLFKALPFGDSNGLFAI